MLKCGVCSTCVDKAIPCVPRARRKRGSSNELERQPRARRAEPQRLPQCADVPQPCYRQSQPGTTAGPSGRVNACTTTATPVVNPALPGGLCGRAAGTGLAAMAQPCLPHSAGAVPQLPPGFGLNPLGLPMQLGQMETALFGGPLLSACMANPMLTAAYMQHPFIPAPAALWAAAASLHPTHQAAAPAPPFGLAPPIHPSAGLAAQPPPNIACAPSAAPYLAPNLSHPALPPVEPAGAGAPPRAAVHQQLPPLGEPPPVAKRSGAPA